MDCPVTAFDFALWIADPAVQLQVGQFFGVGFTIVAAAYLTGWGVRALLSMI